VNKNKAINIQRQRRRFHTRRNIKGTSERPRLSVYRSHKHIACQLIDDMAQKTLVAVSTLEADVKAAGAYGGNKAAAQAVGKKLGELALAAGIKQAAFDRGHFRYHGRVAALADAAREAGLKF
jgi:large subunit ribosomal protein L18